MPRALMTLQQPTLMGSRAFPIAWRSPSPSRLVLREQLGGRSAARFFLDVPPTHDAGAAGDGGGDDVS